MKTVADARQKQFQHDPFVHLLYSYRKKGTIEAAYKARQLLEKLRADGHELTVKHHTIVIDALGRVGELESAEQVYESMSVQPNRVTQNVLLFSHARAGNTVQAEYWLQKMGQEATIEDYNVLLSAYAREGNIHSAEQLIKILVDRCKASDRKCPCEPNLLSYNHLLEACAKRKDSSERTMEISSVAEQKGKVDARTFAAVVRCLLLDKPPEVVLQKAEQFYNIAKEKGFSNGMERLKVSLLDTYVAVAKLTSNTAFRTQLAEKAHALL